MKPVRALLLSLGLLQLAACGHTPPPQPDRVDQVADLLGDANIRPALLVGDNQFNFYFTDPIILRNKAADYVSHVAIRPPQLDIFADDLFAWALDTHAKGKYVIHLGDATNIACVAEWERFTGVMRDAGATSGMKGWVMLPGNHDAYLYGVTGGGWRNAPFNNVGEQWAKACSKQWPIHNGRLNPGWRLTKNRLLDLYFAVIQAQGGRHPKDFNLREVPAGERADQFKPPEGKGSDGHIVKVLRPANPDPAADASFVQEVVYVRHAPPDIAAADPYDYAPEHQSFMVQLLNLSATTPGKKTYALLIDTVDYSSVPVNARGGLCTKLFDSKCGVNAGLTGMVSEHQQKVVEDILRKISVKDAHVILMGHHPLARASEDGRKCESHLDDSSRKWLLAKLKQANILGYISAHTHSGYVQEELTKEEKEKVVQALKCDFTDGRKEINVGSVTDWPMEMRTLESGKPKGGNDKDKNVIHSRLIRLGGNDLPTGDACKAVYNYSVSSHPYLAYYKGNWQPTTALVEHDKTLDTILVTYTRLFADLIRTPNDAVDYLSASAKKTLGCRCNQRSHSENWLADSESCRAKKRNLALCMEQVDDWLKGQPQEAMDVSRLEACSDYQGLLEPVEEYMANRRNYGVCQAVWASQAEYLYTHTERNVLQELAK